MNEILKLESGAAGPGAERGQVVQRTGERFLSAEQFQRLAEVPSFLVWLGNIDNPNTRRAYANDLEAFMAFCGIARPEEFREVRRGHVLAWRTQLETDGLSAATIRRKLSAVASLFAFLCNDNAIENNPAAGVKRPTEGSNEGKTPALSDGQAKQLLRAPQGESLKAQRDRAIIATYLFHALRRNEVASLTVGSLEERRGVMHFRVLGKGSKIRYVPIHPAALSTITPYLENAGHADDKKGALFRPVRSNRPGGKGRALTGDGLYKLVKAHAKRAGIRMDGLCLHALRTTAATNALENGGGLAEVQDWLGHANPATTRLYDRRQFRPEDSPTYKVNY